MTYSSEISATVMYRYHDTGPYCGIYLNNATIINWLTTVIKLRLMFYSVQWYVANYTYQAQWSAAQNTFAITISLENIFFTIFLHDDHCDFFIASQEMISFGLKPVQAARKKETVAKACIECPFEYALFWSYSLTETARTLGENFTSFHRLAVSSYGHQKSNYDEDEEKGH